MNEKYERLYSPEKYEHLGDAERIDICIGIAEAATNWSKLFPMKQECIRETAIACRTAMKLARRDKKAPDNCLHNAVSIRGTMEVEEVFADIQQFFPDRCAACQKLIKENPIKVELEKYTHHERIFLACSDECAKILSEGA
jgi:hypothetical protein